jgi:hypothetical protein
MAAELPVVLPQTLRREGGANVALVTFGSHINPGRESAFAMEQLVERLSRRHAFDYLLIRPLDNQWYLNGACGLGDSVEAVAAALRDFNRRYDKVVYSGNSMGGYAALLYGALSAASEVLVFTPQTNLDSEFRAGHGDGRWREAIEQTNREHVVETYRIATVLERVSSRSRFLVHVGAAEPRDRAQVADIEAHPTVETVLHAGAGHDLVHDLRRTGELERLLAESLGLVSRQPAAGSA